MSRFEILIDLNGSKYALDTYKEEPISLTYNVADVNDIASRNSAFSKTIRLPETRNNRAIFGDIADLGVSPAVFNPNKKTRAWILVDTAVVFEGYLQLRKVFINKETEQGDYEVVIYADNDNFYKQLGDSFISDMNFSELNHIWNKTNIVQSFTASWNNGYYYPLIDYGQDWDLGEVNGWTTTYNTEVKVKDLFPATNVKFILDKMFSDAGYNYTSTFLNSEIFKNLYIPFNKTSFVRDTATSSAGRFTVGMSQSLIILNPTIKNTSRTMQTAGPGGPVATANAHPVDLGTYRIPFNFEGVPFGDPDNLYNFSNVAPNNSTYYYEAPVDFISEQFVCNFDITFQYGINYAANRPGGTPLASICFKRSRNPLTGATVSGGVVVPIGGSTNVKKFINADIPGIQYGSTGGGYTPIGGRQVKGQIATDMLNAETAVNTRKLYSGERLWVEITYAVPANTLRAQNGMIDATSATTLIWQMPVGYTILTFNPTNLLFNSLSSIISPNETIPYNSVIPANVKKKDFMNSLIKMFNLYVEPSKDYPNNLIIEPRDDYYKSGAFKNWTKKLNINLPVEEQILGETQNKKTIFKYKDDKDFYNENYTATSGGLSYGEYDYYIDNDFTSGEKKIELIFSPTPVVSIRNNNAYTDLIIPKIVKNQQDQSQPFMDHNVRILTRFASSTKNSWVYGDYQFSASVGPYNAYVKLTSTGFGNAIHSFKVNDYIKVAQSDGGSLKPLLQNNFKIVEIINNRTIVIDIPFSNIGSGAAVGGVCYPLDGMLGVGETSTWSFEGSKFRAYPYLGHVNNPQAPSYDINFGQTLGLYYPQTIVTNNNLYNIYWENFIEELSDRDSRIITAQFYLNPFDIADFRFNDNIFIENQYYKVNKIINYDPTREALVKVELIKSQYITIPKRINIGDIAVNPGNVSISATAPIRPVLYSGGVITTTGNRPLASGTIIAGRNNVGTGVIVGNDNVVGSDKSLVIGINNNINPGTDGSISIGSNNVISMGLSSSSKYVLGSNNTNAGGGLVVGDFNDVQTGTLNSYLFGNYNIIQTPSPDSDTATVSVGSDATARVFIFGDGNTIGSTTFSSIKDVFIQGTGSTVRSSQISLFGNNITAGTNSVGSYVVGDNVTLNTPNTHIISKARSVIQGGTLAISSSSTFTGQATFSSIVNLIGEVFIRDSNDNIVNLTSSADNFSQVTERSVSIPDSVNGTEPSGGITSFITIADLPIENQGDYSGETIEGITGTALSLGEACYMHLDGKWRSVDTSFISAGHLLGICLFEANAPDLTTTILLRGFYSPGTFLLETDTVEIGEPLYLSTISGHIDNVIPSGTGEIVRVVGYLVNATDPYTVRFSPDQSWIEL